MVCLGDTIRQPSIFVTDAVFILLRSITVGISTVLEQIDSCKDLRKTLTDGKNEAEVSSRIESAATFYCFLNNTFIRKKDQQRNKNMYNQVNLDTEQKTRMKNSGYGNEILKKKSRWSHKLTG